MTTQPPITLQDLEELSNPTPRWVGSIKADANILPHFIQKALNTLDKMELTLARMAMLPRYNATEYWRDGKYLTLVFHQVDGIRERKYIGADEDKIREAQQAIKRFKDYQTFSQDFLAYQRKCQEAARLIDQATALLIDRPPGW